MTISDETFDRMIRVALSYRQMPESRSVFGSASWALGLAAASIALFFISAEGAMPILPAADDISFLARDIGDMAEYDLIETASQSI